MLGLRLRLLMVLLGCLELADELLHGEGVEVEQGIDGTCHMPVISSADLSRTQALIPVVGPKLPTRRADSDELRAEERKG
jgi:hypothetical protein